MGDQIGGKHHPIYVKLAHVMGCVWLWDRDCCSGGDGLGWSHLRYIWKEGRSQPNERGDHVSTMQSKVFRALGRAQ